MTLEISAPKSIALKSCCPALVDVEVASPSARAPRLEVEDEGGRSLAGIVLHAFEADEGDAVNGIRLFRARLLVPAGGLLADGRLPAAIVVRALSRVPGPEGEVVSAVGEARITVVRSL